MKIFSTATAAVVLCLFATSAKADITIQFQEVGNNVEVTFLGSLMSTDWDLVTEASNSTNVVGLTSSQGFVFNSGEHERYQKPANLDSLAVTGLDSYDNPGLNFATPDISSDYGFYVFGDQLYVPGVVGNGTRDAFMPATKVYNNTTIAGLTGDSDGQFDVLYSYASNDGGVTPGYSARFVTSAVPEPSSLTVLGLASIAGCFYRRRRS